jgi:hypothetical protein
MLRKEGKTKEPKGEEERKKEVKEGNKKRK